MYSTQVITEDVALKHLWSRLQQFDLDGEDSALPFAAKLARENGWSLKFAYRTMEEYKRYLFLCIACDAPVCPSEQVDQAWHMHLVYTSSYWDDLCKNVLQQPLHHNPTKGGAEESKKHIDMYCQTLKIYQTFFGQEPPADIWSPTEKRFGEDVFYQRVNIRKYWLLPKISYWFSRHQAGVLSAFLLPLIGLGIFPWNLKGPAFLKFYMAAGAIILILGFILREVVKKLGGAAPNKDIKLAPYEAACIASNKNVIVAAVIAALKEGEHLVIGKKSREGLFSFIGKEYRFKATGTTPKKVKKIETAALQIASSFGGCSMSEMKSAIQKETESICLPLREQGILLPTYLYLLAAWVPLLSCLALLITGLIKMWIGYQLGKPIYYLGCLSIVSAFFTYVFWAYSPRTHTGDKVLEKLKSKQFQLESLTSEEDISPKAAAMAVALFSSVAISAGILGDYSGLFRSCKESMRKQWDLNRSYGDSWFDGWGSGCDGCGSGCGGGCGSGCGGCS